MEDSDIPDADPNFFKDENGVVHDPDKEWEKDPFMQETEEPVE